MRNISFIMATILPMLTLLSSCKLSEEDAEKKIKKHLSQVAFDFDSNSYIPIRTVVNAKKEYDISEIRIAKDLDIKYGKSFTKDADGTRKLRKIVNDTITNLFWDKDFRIKPQEVIPVYHEYKMRKFEENVVTRERFIFDKRNKEIITSYNIGADNTIGRILEQIELAYMQNQSILGNGGDKEEAIKYVL